MTHTPTWDIHYPELTDKVERLATDMKEAAVSTDAALSILKGIIDTVNQLVQTLDESKVDSNDARIPQSDQWALSPYNYVVADPASRVLMGILANGQAVLPKGVTTPFVGESHLSPYLWALATPSGRITEMRLGENGRFPDDVLQPMAQRMARFLPGTGSARVAGVALTLPDSTTPTSGHNNVTARIPVKIGAYSGRWRVHIANINDKSGVAYPGALNFSGVYIGKHQRTSQGVLSGQFADTPHKISDTFTSAANGDEWVSDWVESYPLEAGKDYVLSYGYSSAVQENYLASGGGWQSSNAADVNATAPSLTAAKTMPLDVWLEVEVAGTVKLIAYNGDSLTEGLRSTLPIYDSWPARHAIANGAIHTMYAHGGSELSDWLNPNQRKWAKYAALSKPDALINAHGNNDIYRGAALGTVQANFIQLVNQVRSNLTSNIYSATVLPRIDAAAGVETVRDSYNAWLQQTPAGIQAVFDFASVIEDSSGNPDLRWRSEPDNFHLNTAGYARCFTTINSPLG